MWISHVQHHDTEAANWIGAPKSTVMNSFFADFFPHCFTVECLVFWTLAQTKQLTNYYRANFNQ